VSTVIADAYWTQYPVLVVVRNDSRPAALVDGAADRL
jgi:hypothetical protein